MRLHSRVLIAVLVGGCALLSGMALSTASAADPSAAELEFFEKRIRPILVNHCYECHSVESGDRNGELLVDSREALLQGGESGPAVVPGDPNQSLLILAISHSDKDLKMPPEEKLTATQIADLTKWVKSGAADPRKATSGTISAAPKRGMSLEEGRKFWSFKPVENPPLPVVKDTKWSRTGVDRFILSRLEAAGIAPVADADKRTLMRRVSFDLTGLPPTPSEMAAFLKDSSPQALESVIDRWLASPRYGQRWGRHWLDVVRYADTCGNAADYPVPQAHKYRDWVIDAFNQDMPYDQFLREQIAGDLISGGTDVERRQRTIATGYLAISRRFGGSREGEHHLTIEDTIDNLGRALLGSSIACARCHDHKFDPFTMSDYYGLYGMFQSTRYPFPGAEVGKRQVDFVPLLSKAQIETLLKPHRDQLAALDAKIKQLEADEAEAKKAAESPDRKAKLGEIGKSLAEVRKQKAELQKAQPTIESAYAVAESKPGNAKMQLRGDPERLGDEVPRHFPAILGGQEVSSGDKTSGRLELAQWLTDPNNPLVARVMVNRIWQHHFGRGIVGTSNDFGRQGEAPSHPELLDYLAKRFIESGWSIKSMHKMILLSRCWQLDSRAESDDESDNLRDTLFGRFKRRRLDAESLRDTILLVSGGLDESPAPAHPFPAQHTWNWTQHNPFVANYESNRRSVYLMQQRLRKHPYLALFDGADPSSSTGSRLPSTTPLQALYFLNGELAHGASLRLAALILSTSKDESSQLEFAFDRMLNRLPNSNEREESTAFLQQYREQLAVLKVPAGQVDKQAWAALVRSLLSGNEFAFVD